MEFKKNVMIVLNKNMEVIYPFNFDSVIETIMVKLIAKKAYKGYVYYNTLEDKFAEYYSYDDFIKMDKWKIKFSFQIYLERILKIKHLGFNPTNKTLLRCYLKNCLLKPISNNVCQLIDIVKYGFFLLLIVIFVRLWFFK